MWHVLGPNKYVFLHLDKKSVGQGSTAVHHLFIMLLYMYIYTFYPYQKIASHAIWILHLAIHNMLTPSSSQVAWSGTHHIWAFPSQHTLCSGPIKKGKSPPFGPEPLQGVKRRCPEEPGCPSRARRRAATPASASCTASCATGRAGRARASPSAPSRAWWRSWRRRRTSWTRSSPPSPPTERTPASVSPYSAHWTDACRYGEEPVDDVAVKTWETW